MGVVGVADKGDFIVFIRRIVGGALVAAAIASGVGIVAAPTAAARPRQCAQLISTQQSAFRQWQYMSVTYGSESAGAQAADRAQVIAMARADAAGCYG
jgi:hypothetical protein